MTLQILRDLVQGSDEWLEMRRKKITATDASVIMGTNPWKNTTQLYFEKIKGENTKKTARMQRGVDLEPLARDFYCKTTGIACTPVVVVRDWIMASLDGSDDSMQNILEIKCPGSKDHALAKNGEIPSYYYAQLQHQMYVAGVQKMDYLSFDGEEGVIIEVIRNREYIEKLIEKELKFYQCLMNREAPDPFE